MKKVIRKIVSIIIGGILIAALITGCQEKKVANTDINGKGSFPVTISDVYASKITVEKEPQRIVALAPSIVEVLYKLGLEDKIAGITEYCDYPIEAKSKNKVGDFNGVNIEKIIEAKPDIVLAGAGMSKELFQKLTDLKINVMVAEARTVAQIPETFIMIGKATGCEDKANGLANELTKSIGEISAKVKDAKKIKTYYVLSFGKDGNWTSGKGTFISDLIGISGGENISDDVESWKEYSLEKIVEKDPDIILISGMIANGSKDILNNEKGYKDTSAVKGGKVIILDDNMTQRPGPRIVEGLLLIAKAIHPELFDK